MKVCDICGTSQLEWKDKEKYNIHLKKFPNLATWDTYYCEKCAEENGYV